MATNLTVTSPFDGHAVGDTITDADTVAKLIDRRDVVVPVWAPDPPPAAPPAAPAAKGS